MSLQAKGAIVQETIFEALRDSHKIQRSLIRKLLLSDPGARRDEVFRTLRIELAAHEASEERYLYVHILMDDRGLNSARDALHDHHLLDEIVKDMQEKRASRRGWKSVAKKLSKELHEHLHEEEKVFFQISGKILSETQKTKLAVKYRKDYAAMHKKLEST
jgi:hemerythrin superfamily protein